MDVIIYGNDNLRGKCLPVRKIDKKYADMTSSMIDILKGTKGVGLAGPQVGVQERFFVVLIKNDIPRVFINPSIIETSEKTSVYEEGCLSLPGVWEKIKRPEKIRVQAWNERGRPFTLNAEGLLARVIQHEYDHLEGVLFIDHLSDVKKKRIIEKYEKKALVKNKKR